MRDFRKLEVRKDSIQLVVKVYSITRKFPDTEKFELTSQMNRSAISIPSNIAEGCSRSSILEFSRLLQIALGSSFELETQLEIVKLINLIENETFEKIFTILNLLQKRINAMKSSIRKYLNAFL